MHARAACAVAPGGSLLILGHDVRNLAEGHGGPQDADRLLDPSTVASQLEGLHVVAAETVTRQVDTQPSATALDALVRAGMVVKDDRLSTAHPLLREIGRLREIVGRLDLTILLPPLSTILGKLDDVMANKAFLGAAWVTLEAFLAGNLIAVAIGVPLGVLMGRSIIADRMLLPWVNMLLSAPLTALVPVIDSISA